MADSFEGVTEHRVDMVEETQIEVSWEEETQIEVSWEETNDWVVWVEPWSGEEVWHVHDLRALHNHRNLNQVDTIRILNPFLRRHIPHLRQNCIRLCTRSSGKSQCTR